MQTKGYADELVQKLWDAGVYADSMHSGRHQSKRQEALDKFKQGYTRVPS